MLENASETCVDKTSDEKFTTLKQNKSAKIVSKRKYFVSDYVENAAEKINWNCEMKWTQRIDINSEQFI